MPSYRGLKAESDFDDILGNEIDEQVILFEENLKNLKGDVRRIFDFWCACIKWDSAGSIRLETVRVLCEDFGFNWDRFIRTYILIIDNHFRSNMKG